MLDNSKDLHLLQFPHLVPFPPVPLSSKRPALFTASISTIAAFGCLGYSATAVAANLFEPYVTYTFSSDDNVLGLANDNQYLRLTGRADGSDTTRTARGGIRAAYQISRQQLGLTAELSQTRYSHFQALDYNGRNLQGTWNWLVGNSLSGTIGATDTQSASQLSNFQQITRNLRTDSQIYANTAWMITPSWRAVLNGSKYTLRYDLDLQRYSNIDQSKVESGLSYVAPSGSNVGLLLQKIDGKYPERVRFIGANEDFQQTDAKVNLDWAASGKSRVQLLFGWTSRDSTGTTSRHFSGPTAHATWSWGLSGKTSLTADVWREVAAADDVLASYSVNKGVLLSPGWRLSEKVSLRGDLRYEKREFQGSTVPAYNTDRTTSLLMAYAPLRNIQLQASGFMFIRQGNAYGGGYKRHGATLTVQYKF